MIMGFPAGYTRMACQRGSRGGAEEEMVRCSLVGNAWPIPVVAWLLGQLGFHHGLRPSPLAVLACVEGCSGVAPASSAAYDQADLAKELLKHVNHTGSELRRDPLSSDHPHVWPRRSIDPRWWRWRVIISHAWRQGRGDHIDKLEDRSVLASIRWRARRLHRLNQTFFHLTDSAVAIGVLSRARSSSFHLQFTADRINAILLAAHLRLIAVHVGTKQNPADAPSRKVLKRQKRKAWRGPTSQLNQ